MTARRKLTLTDQVTILCRQAICPKCGQPLGTIKGTEFHHPNELEISKDDSIENRVGMHSDCHAVVTNGTPATSAGSSKHKVAHTRRLANKQGAHIIRMANKTRQEKREKKWKQKIPSRGFNKWKPNTARELEET